MKPPWIASVSLKQKNIKMKVKTLLLLLYNINMSSPKLKNSHWLTWFHRVSSPLTQPNSAVSTMICDRGSVWSPQKMGIEWSLRNSGNMQLNMENPAKCLTWNSFQCWWHWQEGYSSTHLVALVCWPGYASSHYRISYHCWDSIWVLNQQIGVGPTPANHPFVHRVFPYFHHPFWGVFPLFLVQRPYRRSYLVE